MRLTVQPRPWSSIVLSVDSISPNFWRRYTFCSLAVHMVECPLLLLESLLYAHCVFVHLARLPLSRFYRLVGVRVLFLAHIAALWRFAFPSDTRKAKRLSQAGNMTLYKGTINHCRSVFTRARLTSEIVRGRMKS